MKNNKLRLLFLVLLLSPVARAQLSGNYTINPAGLPAPTNFASFTAAVAALTAQGVSDDVVFTVSPGTYTETVTIPGITGAGPDATITFRGSGPDNCILSFNTAAGGIAIGTVNLQGARYVSFRDMTMRNIQAANSAALHIFAGDSNPGTYDVRAEYLSFYNCHFITDTTNTGGNRYGVFISNNGSWNGYSGRTVLAHRITFRKCLFKGGSDGLGVLPSGTSNWYTFPVDSITVDSSEAVQQRSYGLEFWGCKNTSVTNTRIHEMRTGDGNASALRFFHSLEFNVQGNYIICGHRIGLWVDVGGNAATFGPSYAVNNYIVSNGAASQAAYLTGSKQVRYYHNTFLSTGANGVGVDFNGAISGNEFVNNIVAAGTNANVNVFNSPGTAGGFTAIDDNVYYGANGGTVRFYWGTNYTGLAAWQTAVPSFNASSVFGATTFASNSPEITDPATARTGTNLGVAADIFGRPRVFPPTIGAYQYLVPVPLSGVYTINPAGSGARNYASFSAAISDMTLQGVGGNVEFVVSDGIYEEVIVIDDQIAATAGNPYNVVFRSAGGNPQACILRKPASGTPPANIGVGIGVLNIRGAGWDGKLKFFFNNLGIQNFEASNQRAALHVYAADGGTTFERAARNLSFTNCRFQVDTTLTTETSNQMPVMILNANSHGGTPQGGVKYPGEDISFLRCLLQGGTYGLIAKHGDGSNQASGLSVDSCEVKHQRVGNMEIDGYKDMTIAHSTIKEWKGTYASNLGIRLSRCSAFTISGNYIDARRIALWMQVAPAYPATPVWSQVENNYMLTSLDMVVYAQSQQYIAYYHNTFKTYNNPSSDQAVFDIFGSTNIKALNNIMEGPVKTGSRWLVSSSATTFAECDYNVYYGGGTTGKFYNGAARADLAAWQANAPSLNQHSVYAPSALAQNSPVITNADSAHTAPAVGSILTDIYGTPRHATTPTIGAYEYPLPAAPGQPGPFIVKTDTICDPPKSGVRYTINSVPGATAYEWEGNGGWWNIAGAGAGVKFTGGPNDTSVLITFMTGAGTGFLSVRPKNAGGTGPDRTMQIIVMATPAQPGNFTASDDTVCQGQSGVTYTVPNIAGVTYNWSYSGSGATITGSGNSVTVSFNVGATNGTLQVTAANRCGASAARSIAVMVKSLPAQPGNFTASSAAVCAGQTGVAYTVPDVAGSTYTWTYSGSGATINGTGHSVTADFGAAATGGTLGVTAANACGTGSPRNITVTVNPRPAATVTPAAPAPVCDDTVTLTAGSGAGYSYEWKNTAGAVVGSSIAYNAYATGSYRVVVTAAGCRDSSAPVAVTVYPRPQAALTPGDTAFCEGGMRTLHVVTTDTGLGYRWLDGSTILPGAGADFLEVSQTGVYRAIAERTQLAGCADTTDPVAVTVHPLPSPSVTWDGLLLHAGAGYTAYQWTSGGQPLLGATDSTYQPSENGPYAVTVTDTNGCTNTSATVTVGNVGIAGVTNSVPVRVHPNPAGSMVYVDAPAEVTLILTGMDGRVLQRQPGARALHIGMLPEGVYLLRVTTPDGILLKQERVIKTGR